MQSNTTLTTPLPRRVRATQISQTHAALSVIAGIIAAAMLLPPSCMEAMSAAALASRAMPPGKTRQPCTGSDTTNTRSITERGWMPAAD